MIKKGKLSHSFSIIYNILRAVVGKELRDTNGHVKIYLSEGEEIVLQSVLEERSQDRYTILFIHS